jgi:hypothetical protein
LSPLFKKKYPIREKEEPIRIIQGTRYEGDDLTSRPIEYITY